MARELGRTVLAAATLLACSPAAAPGPPAPPVMQLPALPLPVRARPALRMSAIRSPDHGNEN